mgnify:CR=1 FL=1
MDCYLNTPVTNAAAAIHHLSGRLLNGRFVAPREGKQTYDDRPNPGSKKLSLLA